MPNVDLLLLRNMLGKIAVQDAAAGDAPVGFAPLNHTHEGGSPGEHPSLEAHNQLGLVTDVELAAHTHPADEHPDLATHTGMGLAAEHAHPYASDAHSHAATPHPDLAEHESLGLATQTALSVHAHPYASEVHFHPYAADSHTHPGGAHPDLAEHNTLGLVTQAELDAHSHAPTPHADLAAHDALGLATQTELNAKADAHAHPYAADVHTHPYSPESHTHSYAATNHTHAGGSSITTLRTTSNQVINGGAGVFVDVTGLTFPVVAGTDYAFTFYVVFQSAATTTGWKAGVNCPSGTLDFWAGSPTVANGPAGVATHTERHNTVRDDMTLLTATVTQAVDLAVRIEGRYVCTANGTFAARFANELASNTQLVVQRGSWGLVF